MAHSIHVALFLLRADESWKVDGALSAGRNDRNLRRAQFFSSFHKPQFGTVVIRLNKSFQQSDDDQVVGHQQTCTSSQVPPGGLES